MYLFLTYAIVICFTVISRYLTLFKLVKLSSSVLISYYLINMYYRLNRHIMKRSVIAIVAKTPTTIPAMLLEPESVK